MLNDLSPVLVSVVNAILLVLLPSIITTGLVWLVGFTRKEWALFKQSQPVLSDQLAAYAKIAVESAEQAGAAELITSKKGYAIDIVKGWLVQNGLGGIDIKLIEAEIERQVRAMKQDTHPAAG